MASWKYVADVRSRSGPERNVLRVGQGWQKDELTISADLLQCNTVTVKITGGAYATYDTD